MATNYQDNRSVKVTTPFGADVLLFARLSGVERISQPFELDLTLYSEKSDLDADAILGKPLTVTFTTHERGEPRYFHGLVTEFSQTTYGERRHEYRASVRPWFWLLTRTADCRIFQGKSVPDIFADVCRQAGFSDYKLRLAGSYSPWEYCVQYRETDFNFLSRLLEQEGVFYYFEHAKDKHTLVLSDDVAQLSSVPGYDSVPYFPATATDAQRERDHLQSWSFRKSFLPGTFATRDFDFERPSATLAGNSSVSRRHDAARFEMFDYPSEAAKLDSQNLERMAKIRIQELQVGQLAARGEGDAAGLAAGRLFSLTGYPRADLNMQYLVTAASYELNSDNYQTGSGGEGAQFSVSIEAADAREPHRPQRVTPKPIIQGAQTAVVVGTSGEEIWTDKYGRVKVQFHWDRYGEKNENSSCWVRVAQSWAGKNWGAVHIPRIGQEVVVSFLEGDPDHPLVIGSVYNGEQMPPYGLPANQTQSGVKSRSTKQGAAENFNEIRFEDKKDAEEIYIHAEKDLQVVVENNQTISIGAEKKDKGDRTTTIQNDDKLTVGRNLDTTVKENEKRTVDKGRTTSVKEDDQSDVGKKYTLSAGDEITLKVGRAKLVMKKNGDIEIDGMNVKIRGRTNVEIAGAQVKVKGDSKVSIDGAQTAISGQMLDVKGTKTTVKGSGMLDLSASGIASLKGSLTKIG